MQSTARVLSDASQLYEALEEKLESRIGRASAFMIAMGDAETVEYWDLRKAKKDNLEALGAMACRPWELLPSASLRARMSRARKDVMHFLVKDIRSSRRAEHIFHSRFIRGINGGFGLSGSGEPPEGFWEDRYFDYVGPRANDPETKRFRHAPRVGVKTFPRIAFDSAKQPELVRPEIDSEIMTIDFSGRRYSMAHLSSGERRLVTIMAANPERWFTDDEIYAAFGEVKEKSAKLYWQKFRHYVAEKQRLEHGTRPELLEHQFELAQSGDIRLMRMIEDGAARWTGFEKIGLGWMVRSLDRRNKRIEVLGRTVDVSELSYDLQPIVQVILHYPNLALSMDMFEKMHVRLEGESQRRTAVQSVQDLRNPNALPAELSQIIHMTRPRDGPGGRRAIWVADPAGRSLEERLTMPGPEVPPLLSNLTPESEYVKAIHKFEQSLLRIAAIAIRYGTMPEVAEALQGAHDFLHGEFIGPRGLLGETTEVVDVDDIDSAAQLLADISEGNFDWSDEARITVAQEILKDQTVIDADGEEVDVSEIVPWRRSFYAMVAPRQGYVWTTKELTKLAVGRTAYSSKRNFIKEIFHYIETPGYKDNVLQGIFIREKLVGRNDIGYAFVGSSRKRDISGRYLRRAGQGGLEDEGVKEPLRLAETDMVPDPLQNTFEIFGESVDISNFPPGDHPLLRYMLTNRRLILRRQLMGLYEGVDSWGTRNQYMGRLITLIQEHPVLARAFELTGVRGGRNRQLGFPLRSNEKPTSFHLQRL